jgi:glucose dehydrogenase
VIAVAFLLVVLGSVATYLASPNQRLTAHVRPRRTIGVSGLLMVIAGLILTMTQAGRATSVFIALTMAMLVWTVMPIATAWWRRPRSGT